MDWLHLILFGLLGWAIHRLWLAVLRACPKLGKRPKRRRKPLAWKSKFQTYDHPFKTYKTDPPEIIRQKAESCRETQRAANNLAEMRFAEILRQLNIKYDPQRDFQRIVYLPDNINPKGYFVPDFILDDFRTVWEIDGKTHLRTSKRDEGKDQWFAARGYRVIRVQARDVFRNRAAVVLLVKRELGL